MNQDEPDEKKLTYEQLDMVAIFNRLRREIAPSCILLGMSLLTENRSMPFTVRGRRTSTRS